MAAADDWSFDRAVQEMVDAGAFGPDVRLVSSRLDDRHAGQDQFASTVLYCTVVTVAGGRGGGGRRVHRLVLKLKRRERKLRAILNNDSQFHNEMLFYERILGLMSSRLPADGACLPSVCRYFYGRNRCGDLATRDVIVLENAIEHGYRSAVTDHWLWLDFEHLVVALTTLAKFHGLSYRAKHTDRAKFMDAVAGIRETQWDANGEWKIQGLRDFLSVAVDRLAKRPGGAEVERRIREFRTKLLDNPKTTLRWTVGPREPWAVLCHGDFNRNNMLFRYDGGGRPVDVLPFDMATVRYASPALDLSFFLYMNTDRRTRDAHWDALLDAYCAALTASLTDVSDVVPAPTRTELDAEMREHAFYGLAHASLFLRVMVQHQISPVTVPMTDDYRERDRIILSFGGDEATELVADVVQHFINIWSG